MECPFFEAAIYHIPQSIIVSEEIPMTVLEILPSAQSDVATLPFSQDCPSITDSAYSVSAGFLHSPNIAELPTLHFQKAQKLLDEMSDAILSGRVEAFNEAKRQLFQCIRKQGAPLTQWNPLVLVLREADRLQGAQLSQINLDMVRFTAETGEVSLAGAELQGAGFLCADLNQVILTGVDLTGADLRFADLREAQLERAVLIEADLSNAKLSFANLQEANLYCAKLNGSLVKQANLQEANLRKSDLRHTDFYQADLRNARLQQADLREANLFMADLSEAKLRNVDLRKANLGFCALKQARLQNTRLTGANFASADLSQADLQKCRFTGALMSRAVLNATNLQGADFQGVDLSECLELDAALLDGAQFDGDTVFPKGFKIKQHSLVNMKLRGLRRLTRLLSSWVASRPADSEQPQLANH